MMDLVLRVSIVVTLLFDAVFLGRVDIVHGPQSRRNDAAAASDSFFNRHKGFKGECKLPNCFLPYSGIPGGLSREDTPILVYFTFDDGVTAWSNGFFDRFFKENRRNPNGCPIRATHFNSHDNTDYGLVRDLYLKGHEIGSHSVTHRTPPSWWREASKQNWRDEIQGQRERIHSRAGVPVSEIRGSRAPFLQLGGDAQFQMLQEYGFSYDASMSVQTEPPSWPFTLHQAALDARVCVTGPCPSSSYSLWEVPLNILHMDSAHTPRCAMIDGCRPNSKEEAFRFLWQNFLRHANSVHRVPFGVNMHTAWFAWQHNADAMDEFIAELVGMDRVWILPIYKILQWIQKPTPLSRLGSFQPFQC